ncbi:MULTISPECIES: radical SAM family heme chaperone HemW [Burkholderia]|uniref:Heme chaperone HemW n=3 Tax=Burkholderia TaxID=32008 RepID=A0AAW3PZ74_9BURK|nr:MULTISPECIES: radical SAM family heme chaperone HemW [Burkholderia]MEB2501681.1 radical SAM family heme chaperone HemW [Burkholderia anthinoferrum]MEB2529575.1 radical SAM family heme chaperone HemW [Burkholderia anthinoferrum]MEB2561178.1 radical SAM family heme chaperone HemW [Burkholderia anthinoferrum]MEB2580863.1 radical SAM family heme chaperone HemW [Burkholderia anthinoferrum]KWH59783.1 coproporphyrinogen III oxidase [Burkholderia anthina]
MSQAAETGARVVATFTSPGQVRLTSLPPLALYVHFPWCVRKCPYCDFNSHEWKGERFPEAEYLDALRADLEQALPLVWGRQVHTVFIGGGTPSLLSAAGLDRMLSDVRALLPLDADAEITLEANPGTFEAAKFAQFRASGVNRLSVGIQSFNEAHLKALGRIHDTAQARAAVEIAAKNFDNFNLDLMFALPNQTLDECRADIETALSFAPPHLSLYHLTLEPNTLFAKFPPVVPDDDASADMQEWIHARTAEAGYGRYEVSAYAKPNHQCKHNLNYWRFGDYLGIGAGAHTKLSFPNRILRQARYKHPATFIEQAKAGTAVQEEREVGARDLPFEFMLNTLRLVEGFPVHSFAERTGLPMSTIEPALKEAERRGLITRDFTQIAPTPLGQRFLNDLQELFLRDD